MSLGKASFAITKIKYSVKRVEVCNHQTIWVSQSGLRSTICPSDSSGGEFLGIFFCLNIISTKSLVDMADKSPQKVSQFIAACHSLWIPNKLCGSKFANWFVAYCPLVCKTGSVSIPKGVTTMLKLTSDGWAMELEQSCPGNAWNHWAVHF